MATTEQLNMSGSELVMQQFHRCLNNTACVPAKAYRRNSNLYPLVCYVNNLTGAVLSENYEVIPVFVARAAEHIAQVPPSEEASSYYALVTSYLAQVVHHLQCAGSPVEFDAARIPASIFSAGPQPAPNPSIERTCPGKPGHAAHVER
jgi:hypothetical protein